jgi:hypothetical protein
VSAEAPARPVRAPRVTAVRRHDWSAVERATLISVVAIVMGALFVTCYLLALGDSVPLPLDAALVGDPAVHAPTVRAVEGVAQNSITVFQAGSQAGPLRPRHWTVFVVALAVGASLVFTLVDGPLLDRVALPVRAVASFASLMLRLIGRWAIV